MNPFFDTADFVEPEQFKLEVAVMHAMQSYTKHTVQLLGWCNTPMGLCMEKYDTCLQRLLFKTPKIAMNGGLGVTHVFKMMREICDAMAACEELLIVHCDLKPGDKLENE